MIPQVVAGEAVGNFLWHFIKRFCAFLFCVGLLWALYVAFVRPTTKPNPTEKYQAETQEFRTTEIAPKQTFFGCNHFQIVQDKQKMQEIQVKPVVKK